MAPLPPMSRQLPTAPAPMRTPRGIHVPQSEGHPQAPMPPVMSMPSVPSTAPGPYQMPSFVPGSISMPQNPSYVPQSTMSSYVPPQGGGSVAIHVSTTSMPMQPMQPRRPSFVACGTASMPPSLPSNVAGGMTPRAPRHQALFQPQGTGGSATAPPRASSPDRLQPTPRRSHVHSAMPSPMCAGSPAHTGQLSPRFR